MARPTKRQRQAKLQRASSAKAFDNGFVENLLEIALDHSVEHVRQWFSSRIFP